MNFPEVFTQFLFTKSVTNKTRELTNEYNSLNNKFPPIFLGHISSRPPSSIHCLHRCSTIEQSYDALCVAPLGCQMERSRRRSVLRSDVHVDRIPTLLLE